MSLPGPKTTLTLKEITRSVDSAGFPNPPTPSTVQALIGVLQPLRETERVEYGKTGVKADSVFYVHKSQFTSTANEAKLVEGNILASATVNYEIIGKQYWNGGSIGIHYKIILQELK